MNAPDIDRLGRMLTASFATCLIGLGLAGVYVGPETPLENFIFAAGLLCWLVAGLMFYVVLGVLAARLHRSVLVWVGGSAVLAPIGPFIAYFNMRRLIREATLQAVSDTPSGKRVVLTGWIRLGIVLSVAWLLLVCAYAGYDYWRINSVEAGWETVGSESGRSARNFFDQFDEPTPKSLLVACGVDGPGRTTSCSLRPGNFLVLALVPLAGGWVFVVLAIFAAVWVRAGFHDDA